MSAAQRFLLLVHGALGLGFLAYTALLVRLYVEDASAGYISEGAKVGLRVSLVTTACVVLVAAGTSLWARTGKQRFIVAADLAVGALSWTALLVLMFFDPLLYVGFLGLTLLATLVAVVVPPPKRPVPRSDGG